MEIGSKKDECERWSSRNRTERQHKQSTKVTRDNVLVVAPVKCQQVNRDFAALEDELEVLKESLADRPVPALRTKSNGKSYSPWVCAKLVISYKILICFRKILPKQCNLFAQQAKLPSDAFFRAQLLKIPSPKK